MTHQKDDMGTEALAAARKVIAQDRDVLVRSYSDASGSIDADAQPFLTEYDETLALIDAALASKPDAAPAGGAEAQTVEALEFLFLAIVTRADSDYLFRAVNRANAALEVAMPGWTAPVPMTGWAALAAAPVVPPQPEQTDSGASPAGTACSGPSAPEPKVSALRVPPAGAAGVSNAALALDEAQVNHLRRLLGWVRCDISQSPEELVATVRGIAPQLQDISQEGKARLVEQHMKASNVPKYIRAAVNALGKLLGAPETAVAAAEATPAVLPLLAGWTFVAKPDRTEIKEPGGSRWTLWATGNDSPTANLLYRLGTALAKEPPSQPLLGPARGIDSPEGVETRRGSMAQPPEPGPEGSRPEDRADGADQSNSGETT